MFAGCRITFEKEGVRQQSVSGPAAAPALGGPTASQIAIGQTYIPSHMDREHRMVRHHNPSTGFVSSRPQATVVAPNGDEREPDGTVRSHQEATAASEAVVHREVSNLAQSSEASPEDEQALQQEVQRVAQDVQAEGMTPASNPDKARIQNAWDSHFVPDAKKADASAAPDYSLQNTTIRTESKLEDNKK